MILGLTCIGAALLITWGLRKGWAALIDDPLLRGILIATALGTPPPLLFTAAFRGRIHRWLGSVGKSGSKEQEAAAVASLIDGYAGGVAAALETAADMFYVLPLQNLSAADLTSSADTGLNTKVTHAMLGSCDAFMSHSWQDDGNKKFARLHEHEWGAADPSIWLDKACIDQRRIDQSLVVLPIFLSGCRILLVLPGATYASRLWCVIELYVFFQMGGEREALVVKPLDPNDADVIVSLAQFDAAKAQCFLAHDREKLLAIIESSFGTCTPFNKIVRQILLEKLAGAPERRRSLFQGWHATPQPQERHLERPLRRPSDRPSQRWPSRRPSDRPSQRPSDRPSDRHSEPEGPLTC